MAVTASGSSSLDNSFWYDASANQHVFNLSTKSLSAGTHALTIVLDDGSERSVSVKLSEPGARPTRRP
jgi:hypothetical protein